MSDHLTEQVSTDCELMLNALLSTLGGQMLVSQDRCVDGLLDVYNTAPSAAVRELVASVITDIQHLSAVRSTDLLGRINEISAAIAIESALFLDIGDDPVEGAVAEA